MPSFIVHGLIPPLLLLALRLAPPRVALLMLPFTFLPDLDYFVGVHRAWTGNVFILVPTGYLWFRWRELDLTKARYMAVATYYMATHLFMDVFAGGTLLLWPVLDTNFFFLFEVFIDTQTNQPVPVTDIGTEQGAPQVARFFRWISSFETAMAALTVVVVVATLFHRGLERRREVYLEEIEA